MHQINGTVVPTVQTVRFTRTNTTNEATGQVIHTNWAVDGNDSFAEYTIPAVDGYHAEVNGNTVTAINAVNNVAADAANSVVDVYYVANNNRPSDTTTTTETRAITRTINLHEPDGSVMPHIQSVHFNRTNTTTDGQTTYGEWTADGNNNFAAYNIPTIAGYHATLNGRTVTVVPAANVTADMASSIVDVYYVADPVQPTTPTTPVNPSQPTTPTTPVNPSTPNKPSDHNNTQPNNPSQPTTPANPSTPAQPGKPSNTQPNASNVNKPSAQGTTISNGSAANQQNGQQKLPQTGNDKAGILGLAGLALTGLAMMFGSDKRRDD